MRLTKKKAIEITKELWDWLAETGAFKHGWLGWKKYGRMAADCPLCEYTNYAPVSSGSACGSCPYFKVFGDCGVDGTLYVRWCEARTDEDRKLYAGQFREQLEQL